MTAHPGLGEPTDITPESSLAQQEQSLPASSDQAQMEQDGLGTGDGPDLAGSDDSGDGGGG